MKTMRVNVHSMVHCDSSADHKQAPFQFNAEQIISARWSSVNPALRRQNDQKKGQELSRRPGITTIRKKAQLISVNTLMNLPPCPGKERT